MTDRTGCLKTDLLRTVSGLRVSMTNPKPEQFELVDIAVGLSNQCRFGGQVHNHYSVAEHSVACSENAKRCGADVHIQMACLMHDAAEAYLGDVIRPLKNIMGGKYLELESRMQAVIDKRFNIDCAGNHEVIKLHDNAICEAEMKVICYREYLEVKDSFANLGEFSSNYEPKFLPPKAASLAFINRFSELYNYHLGPRPVIETEVQTNG